MPSPASGPYKSRLLNLIAENYYQFLDNWGLAWRQVQFSTATAIQTAFYSVYSVFESLINGKQQLQFTPQNSQPQLNASPASQLGEADRLILETLAIAKLEVKRSKRIKIVPETIKAIACCRQTQKIVLVGEDHEIFDQLSWTQQVKLRQLILRKVAILEKQRKPIVSFPKPKVVSTAITIAQNYTTAITRQTQELRITLAQTWKTNSTDLTLYTSENHSLQTSVSASLHQVQAVIWAAIDYFFFKDHNEQLNLPPQAEKLISGKPQKYIPPTGKIQPLTPSQKVMQISAPKIEKNLEKGLTISPVHVSMMSDACKYFDPSKESDQQEVANCVQTEATAVGYVKHPLERVLEWVDRVLYWVEETLIQAWAWVKQHWSHH